MDEQMIRQKTMEMLQGGMPAPAIEGEQTPQEIGLGGMPMPVMPQIEVVNPDAFGTPKNAVGGTLPHGTGNFLNGNASNVGIDPNDAISRQYLMNEIFKY